MISNERQKSDRSHSGLRDRFRKRLGAAASGLIGLQAAGLEGAEVGAEMGALAVAERDYGFSQDQLSDLADSIPPGSAAAIMVIERHWATRLRDAIVEVGGVALAQAISTLQALVIVGRELEAMIEAEAAIEAAEAIKYAPALEVAPVLVEAEMIEDAAIAEAADLVAAALAVEDAAAQEAADALLAAALIEEATAEETAAAILAYGDD